MEDIEAKLAEYILVLEKSSQDNHCAQHRIKYKEHLATAALMYIALKKHKSLERLKDIVQTEKRSYGWDEPLDGEPGEAAERAFGKFANYVDSK